MAPNNFVAVTIQKLDNSLSKAKSLDFSVFFEKQKAASPKQFTWVLLLKVNRIFACLSWLPMAFRKRIALSDMSDEEPRNRGKLYTFIKAFLMLSIVASGVEVIAHYKNWNLNLVHQPWEVQGLVHWSYMAWLSFRVDYIAPVAIFLSKFCIVLFLIQSLDRLVLCLGCFWIKFKKV